MNLRENLRHLVPYSAGKKLPGVLKLSSNENPLGPSPRGLEFLAREAAHVSVYPEGTALALRTALAERDGLTPEHYLVGNGSDEVLTLIAGAYINPRDRALTAAHTFSEYGFAVQLFGGLMDTFHLDDQGALDLTRAGEDVKSGSYKMVFLCNPNNPTGGYFPQEALESFLKSAPEDLLVVVDEAYREYSDAPDYPQTLSLLPQFKNLIITRTFSKIYGLAALRVGYAIGHPEIIRDLSVVKQPFNVGTLSQAAALGSLGDRSFIEESLRVNKAGKNFWYQACQDLGLKYYPTQANFIALKPGLPAKEVYNRMVENGVTIRPLDSFGLPEWIRITLGTEEQNQICLRALKKALGK